MNVDHYFPLYRLVVESQISFAAANLLNVDHCFPRSLWECWKQNFIRCGWLTECRSLFPTLSFSMFKAKLHSLRITCWTSIIVFHFVFQYVESRISFAAANLLNVDDCFPLCLSVFWKLNFIPCGWLNECWVIVFYILFHYNERKTSFLRFSIKTQNFTICQSLIFIAVHTKV